MEDVLEKVAKRSLTTVAKTTTTSPKTTTHPNHPGVEFDENGEPIGACTVVELFDKLDRKFVEFYGEYGRRIVNARREEWNRDGLWHFDLF